MTVPERAAHDLLVIGANPAIDRYYCLDQLRVGDVNRVTSVRAAAGGKANNLARAYRRLGGNPITTGIVAGETGHRILTGLATEGIAHDYVCTDGESRQTVTLLAAGATTVLLEPGPLVPETALDRLVEKVAMLALTVSGVAITGSLPSGAPGDTVARLVRAARTASSGPIAVDTSGEALRIAALAGPHLIKVNVEEYERAFGQPADDPAAVEAHVRSLADHGVEILCLTDGPRGALVLTAQERFAVRTEAPDPVSTAGAGDAFLAGLLLALLRGDELTAAARLASAAAAAALRQVGAGFIEPADVDADLSRTRLLDARSFFAEPRP
ncbi:MAG: 1-phosphofructokinase family hexose kinase [Thermomicrobiales bacterium]